MIVYIIGNMEGNHQDYWPGFAEAEEALENMGCTVLNPGGLPGDMPEGAYMPICMAMLQQADAVYCMPGWAESLGSTVERQFALYQRKPIFENINSPELAILADMNFGR